MSDDTNKPVLLVKKKDSKKGSLWNAITNRRIIKQHGGFDIPEGDLHAIPKYTSPIDEQKASPEETKETLSELEKEIQKLKEKDKHTKLSPRPTFEAKEELITEQSQNSQDQDDDFY